MGQVVVDRLGHANHAKLVAALDRLFMDLFGRVLRIVPARVEEIANIVGFEDLEQPVHVACGTFGLFLEIDFVPARAEGSSRGVLQPFDGMALLLQDIDEILVEHPENAIAPAVDFLDCVRVLSRFLDHASHTGVNDGRRAAGLCHKQIAN